MTTLSKIGLRVVAVGVQGHVRVLHLILLALVTRSNSLAMDPVSKHGLILHLLLQRFTT
jgi:hypothetical protein